MKDHARIRANRAKKAARNATPRQRKERARRQAMGIALIQRPLRFIDAATHSYTVKKGRSLQTASPDYAIAHEYASRGFGAGVRATAYGVLRGSIDL